MGSNFFVKVVIIRKALCQMAEGFSNDDNLHEKIAAHIPMDSNFLFNDFQCKSFILPCGVNDDAAHTGQIPLIRPTNEYQFHVL